MAFVLLLLVPSSTHAEEGHRASIELRVRPPVIRQLGTPSLCPMLAIPLSTNILLGGGYELIQYYDETVRISNDELGSPLLLSGLRLAAWYRGGATKHGMSYSAGPNLTFSHPSISLVKSPKNLDAGTYAFDVGMDLSLGYVWDTFRLEAAILPAWSFGRITTAGYGGEVRFSGPTVRIALGLAWLL